MRIFVFLITFFVTGSGCEQSSVPTPVVNVVSGGYWEDAGQRGIYRVILTAEGWEHVSTRVKVEWIAEPKTQNEQSIIVAPKLPFGQETASLKVEKLQPLSVGCLEILLVGVISATRVGWADVRKPNIWGHHRPMNVGLRTSAQPTG
ncbi:MAG: hypothetical protein HC877_15895 [Thioploca sp.]|nr:hypothetical protein [Thioploca sp.]